MPSRRHVNASCLLLFLLIATLLAFAPTTNAQLTNLPDISSITQPVGAKHTKSTSKTSSSSKSTSMSTSRTSVQSVTRTVSSSHGGGLTNAPTLYGVGVPPLIVPDTSDAPFMQKSDLPEGTVFICVGAALGFLGMSVLAWRGLVAWSLHRSVRRAAKTKYASEKKSAYGGAPPVHYSNMYHSADVSLEHLASTNTAYDDSSGQSHGKTSKPPKKTSARGPTNNSLFFSPTAGTGQAGPANRTSSYLPAGFYASGASMPAAGSAIAQLGGPPAAEYGRVGSVSSSPPATPGHARAESTETNLNHGRHGGKGKNLQEPATLTNLPRQRSEPPRRSGIPEGYGSAQQRAPSAVLDDLFQRHPGMRERN